MSKATTIAECAGDRTYLDTCSTVSASRSTLERPYAGEAVGEAEVARARAGFSPVSGSRLRLDQGCGPSLFTVAGNESRRPRIQPGCVAPTTKTAPPQKRFSRTYRSPPAHPPPPLQQPSEPEDGGPHLHSPHRSLMHCFLRDPHGR